MTDRLVAEVNRALHKILGAHVDLHLFIVLHLGEDLSFRPVTIRFLQSGRPVNRGIHYPILVSTTRLRVNCVILLIVTISVFDLLLLLLCEILRVLID